MSERLQPVSVNILGKEYKIACPEEEKETLLDSARELDIQMRKIRDSGKVTSPDRIAVMAALNLTHELKQIRESHYDNNLASAISEKLVKLRQKIENVLEIY